MRKSGDRTTPGPGCFCSAVDWRTAPVDALGMSNSHVFDVTSANFQEVVRQSAEVPVLLDFWADWCGPCKTLTPVLEAIATEYGGAFTVGKVDTEAERELAAAFRVQSIPFGVLLAGGRPVDAFSGAIPERELRDFLAKAGIQPLGADTPEDPETPTAKVAAAKTAIAGGDAAAAAAALEGIEEDSELFGESSRLRDGLSWLDANLDSDVPSASLLSEARRTFLAGRIDEAMQAILESIERDRDYAEGLGRRAMLLCFSMAGEDSELSGDFRRRMATLLY